MKKVTQTPHSALRTPNFFSTRLISLLVAELFLFSSVLPAWALQTNSSHLRPSAAKDGATRNNLRQELKDTQARDGGQLTLPSAKDFYVLKNYEALVNEIVGEIDHKRQKKGKGQFWVGVGGSPASGKSSLAKEIVSRLKSKGIHVIHISMDMWIVERLIRDAWEREGDPRFYRYRKEWIRWTEHARDIDRIRETFQGKLTLQGLYDIPTGIVDRTKELEIFPDTVVVYDGAFLADPALYPPDSFDLSVLLDAPPQGRHVRRIARDTVLRGRSPEQIKKLTRLVYDPEWKTYVEEIHPETASDLVYDVTSFEHPARLYYGNAARDGSSHISGWPEFSFDGPPEAGAQYWRGKLHVGGEIFTMFLGSDLSGGVYLEIRDPENRKIVATSEWYRWEHPWFQNIAVDDARYKGPDAVVRLADVIAAIQLSDMISHGSSMNRLHGSVALRPEGDRLGSLGIFRLYEKIGLRPDPLFLNRWAERIREEDADLSVQQQLWIPRRLEKDIPHLRISSRERGHIEIFEEHQIEIFLVDENGRAISDEAVYRRLSNNPEEVQGILRKIAEEGPEVVVEGKRYHVWVGGVEYVMDPAQLPQLSTTIASLPRVPWAPENTPQGKAAKDGGAKPVRAPSRWNLVPFYSP